LGELARSLSGLGQEEETATVIQELLALLKRTHSNHTNCIAPLRFAYRWSAQTHANAQSLEAARVCLVYLERIEAQFNSQESSASLAEARGIEALRNEQHAVAVEQFQQAAIGWRTLQRPYDQARALNDVGQTLLRTGDGRHAQAAFDQANSLIESLAGQLDEPALRSSFLNSALVQEIRTGRANVTLARPY
jgi:hypothetical protein